MFGTDPSGNEQVFIVIAAYNESRSIRGVVNRLRQTYANVVVVDDGSTDGTADCLTGSGAYVLRHIVNRGQGAALQTGIAFSLAEKAEIILTFDADGQHDAGDIDTLIAPVAAGEYDVVLGSRFLGRAVDIPMRRLLVLKAGILFTRVVSRMRVSDTHNGLRAFSRRAAESIHITIDRMGHASEILDQVREHGLRYCEVPVTVTYSQYSLERGQSSWNALVIGSQMLLKKVLR
jgi:glycosyltransferase involved in cell wall biosynthesis